MTLHNGSTDQEIISHLKTNSRNCCPKSVLLPSLLLILIVSTSSFHISFQRPPNRISNPEIPSSSSKWRYQWSKRHSPAFGRQSLFATNDEYLQSASPSSMKNYSKTVSKAWTIDGPPVETRPDYENIHGPLGKSVDRVFLSIFRTKMAEKVGLDSNLPKDDYAGLMELTAKMNSFYSDRREVQNIAQDILRSLFPSWLPGAFAIMFAQPFPNFSSRMNAWATKMAGTWLMGECEINDCEIDGGAIGKNQGLLVKRCRFLEESRCASVCVNSCKIPTQRFFAEDMGLPLTMTPDYETGECQFSFGLTPTSTGEFDAKNTPCLSGCPTMGSMRLWHDGFEEKDMVSVPKAQCALMGKDDQVNGK